MFLNKNVSKNRAGLNLRLENYLYVNQKWTENWLENFLSLDIK